MPELPEVETVVRTLENKLGNCKILSVSVLYDRIVETPSVKEFRENLQGQHIIKYDRRGKFLIFELDDYIMITHLRMEGKFYCYQDKQEPSQHTHIVFQLEQGQLHYNDVRKFGRFYLYRKTEELNAISQLGLEPFDEKLNPSYCHQYCQNKKLEIKSMLLDQHFIAGIGNIYANEICFASNLDPLTPSCFISEQKWQEIINHTQRILTEAIDAGGSTIRSYTSSLGVTGLFQQSLFVHSRQGQPCLKCNEEVQKMFVNGRGTYYCPKCQKRNAVTIAITGSMGSGKSEVTKYLDSKGYKTISCDAINAKLLEQEQTKKALADIFNCKKELVNKAFISKQIFSNSDLKEKVEHYLHTRIFEIIQNWIKENNEQAFLFIEVPLLFETGWNYYFDYNVDVYSPMEVLIKRLRKNRKMSEEEIKQRLDLQYSIETKKQLADYVIFNDESMRKMRLNIGKFIAYIVKLDLNRK